jgi:diguanylate cyclase (GGDEF)-like protein/PAS domain S-box-containing protein
VTPETERLALEQALRACAREPIHQIGSIQPAGVMIAVAAAGLEIRSVSANLECLFPCAPQAAIGQPLERLIGADAVDRLRQLMELDEWPGATIWSLAVPRPGRLARLDAQVFRSDDLVVIEIEFEQPDGGDVFHEIFLPIRDALWKLDAEADLQHYTRAVVDQVRLLTGYDRVMMYRFDSNWDGEVIAESKLDQVGSYLGNRFPASDIPPQARELYTRNLVRLIADVDAVPVPLVQAETSTTPVTLTHSWLRSMSPVHVTYLRNMGVQASMSISLVQNNRLWGLIACHHFSPKYVSLRSRELNEFIGRVVSLKLINMDNAERASLNSRSRDLLYELTGRIRQSGDLDGVIRSFRQEFLGLVRASGAVIAVNHRRHTLGEVPPDAVLAMLVARLRTLPVAPVFHTDHLGELMALDEADRDIVSGLMVAPLDHQMANYILWFRPGVLRTLRWAGRPAKLVVNAADGPRISPRLSFETWVETYRDKSMAWSQAEVDAANALSLALMEVLTQRALESSEESYRLLAENSTDLIARLDLAMQFVFVSPAIRDLLGVGPEQVRGRSIEAFIVADDQASFREVFVRLREPGASETTLIRCARRDGKVVWAEAKLKRVSGSSGQDEIVVNARDVTQRHTYQLAIEELNRRNTRILDSAGEGLVSLDTGGKVIYVNDVAARFFGSDADALIGGHCCDILCGRGAGVCADPQRCPFLGTLADAETRQGVQALWAAGERTPIKIGYICTPLVENNRITGCVVVLSEVADDQAVPLTTSDIVLDQTLEAVMVTDADGRITSVNRAFTEITGYALDEALGETPRILRSGVHTPNFYAEFWRTLKERRRWAGEVWNRRKNGEVYPQWGSVTAVLDSDAAVRGYVAVFSDISKAKQAEEKLYYLANHDALTGLPNRIKFNEHLTNAIERAKRSRGLLAVVFIDLDRFKLVNDTLGHAVGDIYLKQVGERLAQRIRRQDTLARWGGDEFVAVLEEAGDRASVAEMMERLLARIAQPLVLEGRELMPTASCGISVYPDDGRTAGDLVRAADAAMYRAKDKGRNGFEFYAARMGTEVGEKLLLAGELRRAMHAGELCLYYQPQIDVLGGSLHGIEALCRWRHPIRGVLPPAQFIPLAEELGLIVDLGAWVLDEACRQILEWSALGLPVPQMAINVAPAQLKESFVDHVGRVLASSGIQPERLELEITEGALEAGERVREVAHGLRALGVLLSVDDFGTGYSSLAQLKHLPITCFKIDKSFVDGLPGSSEDAAIVNTILALGSSLDVDVIAEGVETAAQAEFLRVAGVRHIQGYFYSRPMTAEAMTEFLRDQRRLQ